MTTVDLKSLLTKNFDEVTEPKLLPQGTYHGIITKFEFTEARNEDKTPVLRYTIQLTSAGEDIDPADLEGIDIPQTQVSKDFFITEKALFMVKRFFEDLGIDTAGTQLDLLAPEPVNQSVILNIGHRPNKKNPERPFVSVGDVKLDA